MPGAITARTPAALFMAQNSRKAATTTGLLPFRSSLSAMRSNSMSIPWS
jgi:hypothetical protein